MRFVVHLKPAKDLVHVLREHLNVLNFLRSKNLKADWHPYKRMISFEATNPGMITHLKSKFKDSIVGIFSDKHGAGLYRRPSQRSNNLGIFGPSATSLTPLQVAKAYNFPKPGPTLKKKTVAIIELGGAFDPKNVLSYCKQLGVPAPAMYKHMVDGATEVSDPNGADGEVSLDIDVVAAVAPGVQILMVFAPNTTNGFIDAIAGMPGYFLKPDAISISWGSSEQDWDSAAMEALSNAIQDCVNHGINVFVAAGDNGSSDGSQGNNVDFPASSPYSIGCGGTKLILNSDGTRNSEVVWNETLSGEGATGGGVSKVYPNRKVPDISGNADPQSGYIVDVDGQQQVIGGTSAVAPLMAGLTVLLASQAVVPDLSTVLYKNPQVCFDVVQGNNGAYKAGPGYDCCTGLGVPDGTKLLALLQPTLKAKIMNFLKKPVGDLFLK